MKIVVVSPHPDDESLGAGGLIAKHKKAGDQVFWINITDVEEKEGWDKAFIEKRKIQIEQVCRFYNFDRFYNLKFQPAFLENTDKGKIIDAFSKCICEIEPDWVILPNPVDAHSDHRITYEVGMSCTKSFRYPSVKKIMTMEIISETDYSKTGEAFSPNYFIDITDEMENKLNALSIYDTELGVVPFPRNLEAIKALALLRGGQAGCQYAEAFKIIKEIEK